MGGLGSGRRKKRQRTTVETCLMLDADRLSLMGNLRSGLPGFYHWPDRNASIGFRTELARGGDLLHLFWLIPITTASSSGEEWQAVADTIPLERRPRHFGGYIFYFRCPEPAIPIPVTGWTPFLGHGFLGPFDSGPSKAFRHRCRSE